MTPQKITLDEKNILGLTVRTNNQNEQDPKTAKIMGLWNDFFTQDLINTIPNREENTPMFGIYSDYSSDVNGDYSVTAGVQVTTVEPQTQLQQVTIKAGEYLVFKAKGDMPNVVIETWQQIWAYFEESKITRAYSTDFEAYVSDDEVQIYISV